jgi:hypothetical protein
VRPSVRRGIEEVALPHPTTDEDGPATASGRLEALGSGCLRSQVDWLVHVVSMNPDPRRGISFAISKRRIAALTQCQPGGRPRPTLTAIQRWAYGGFRDGGIDEGQESRCQRGVAPGPLRFPSSRPPNGREGAARRLQLRGPCTARGSPTNSHRASGGDVPAPRAERRKLRPDHAGVLSKGVPS